MHVSHQFVLPFVFVLFSVTGCHKPTPDEIIEDSITEQYVSKYVRPMSDPIAALVHKGVAPPPELLVSNRVTAIEVIPNKGEGYTMFKDEARRPPSHGMITVVNHARNIGLFYPASLDQADIEVRMNYSCDIGDFVAVHVVVPNPLLLKKEQ
jgi:hypothetical protein